MTTETDAETPIEGPERAGLLEQLRAANQMLRRQAVVITAISFVAFALMDMSRVQYEENQELYGKIALLESLRDAPDLGSHLEESRDAIERELVHDIDTDALIFELERSQFSDRAPVVEAVSKLKERRRGLWGVTDRTINVVGVSVPVSTWFYLVPFLILILFHNFTQLVFFRGRLLRTLEVVEDWE